MYKKLLVLPKPMLGAHLLASDFPSENPRTQTRNFPYTNTILHNSPKGEPKWLRASLLPPFGIVQYRRVLPNCAGRRN